MDSILRVLGYNSLYDSNQKGELMYSIYIKRWAGLYLAIIYESLNEEEVVKALMSYLAPYQAYTFEGLAIRRVS